MTGALLTGIETVHAVCDTGFVFSGGVWNFDYMGENYQTFVAPMTGYYQFEAWGARGGNSETQP